MNMKRIFYFTIVAVIMITACQTKQSNKLVGTWKLIEYADFDSVTGKWTHPYGDHPRGYFTYTNSGIVNLNISSENPLIITRDSAYKHSFTLVELIDNYAVGYFGTYTIDYKNSTVTHHPKGGAIPWILCDILPRAIAG